jgi:hypothetical protein
LRHRSTRLLRIQRVQRLHSFELSRVQTQGHCILVERIASEELTQLLNAVNQELSVETRTLEVFPLRLCLKPFFERLDFEVLVDCNVLKQSLVVLCRLPVAWQLLLHLGASQLLPLLLMSNLQPMLKLLHAGVKGFHLADEKLPSYKVKHVDVPVK